MAQNQPNTAWNAGSSGVSFPDNLEYCRDVDSYVVPTPVRNLSPVQCPSDPKPDTGRPSFTLDPTTASAAVGRGLTKASRPSVGIEERREQLIEDFEIDFPPELGKEQFDAVFIYCEHDAERVIKLKDILTKFITLEGGRKPKFCILDDLPEVGSRFKHMEVALSRSTYMFFFITKEFIDDSWCEMQKDEALMKSNTKPDKQGCAVPLLPGPRKELPFDLSFGLESLKEMDLSNMLGEKKLDDVMAETLTESDLDHRFLCNITKLLNVRLNKRLQREKAIETKRSKYADEQRKKLTKKKQQQRVRTPVEENVPVPCSRVDTGTQTVGDTGYCPKAATSIAQPTFEVSAGFLQIGQQSQITQAANVEDRERISRLLEKVDNCALVERPMVEDHTATEPGLEPEPPPSQPGHSQIAFFSSTGYTQQRKIVSFSGQRLVSDTNKQPTCVVSPLQRLSREASQIRQSAGTGPPGVPDTGLADMQNVASSHHEDSFGYGSDTYVKERYTHAEQGTGDGSISVTQVTDTNSLSGSQSDTRHPNVGDREGTVTAPDGRNTASSSSAVGAQQE